MFYVCKFLCTTSLSSLKDYIAQLQRSMLKGFLDDAVFVFTQSSR